MTPETNSQNFPTASSPSPGAPGSNQSSNRAAGITLPLSKGGIICGAVFAFVTSYDDFNISLLLSGVGATPLPIQLFDYLRFSFDPPPAVAGTISIAITAFVVLLVQRLVGLDALWFGKK